MAQQKQSVEEFKGRPRLPRFALPRQYDLTIALDLVCSTFSGAVEIAIDVVSSTRFLVLNAADLSVDHQSVWFRSQGSVRQETKRPLEIVEIDADEILGSIEAPMSATERKETWRLLSSSLPMPGVVFHTGMNPPLRLRSR
ncbi:hypothetical protein OPV22_017445 [Ensete ventricosum]|uniref:Aminopeptidase N-like N-terminal domain-containing protein n=1 Tax=Ensete ventricosum TaxID=4639 RepID=A0AAV8PF81_ENSVE|nr:hypothetical protein OPV22_017445 [Ensete ventricosum]